MQSTEDLNRRFAIGGTLHFDEVGGLPVARLGNRHASAAVCLQGAHVTHYQPHGHEPLIWLSDEARFAPGKSLRGGVPICWPWFGPHPDNPQWPAHGFARTVPWQLLEADALPDGRTRLVFELPQDDVARALWPHPARLRHTVTVGQELEVQLATRNDGELPFVIGQALHTYFRVGDVARIAVHGLDRCEYLDKADGGARKRQAGPVTFAGETDRVYLGTAGCCVIRDEALARAILVTATGSRSTVVWNPGVDKAAKMGDFGPAGHQAMVCVETANAAEDTITLGPGEEHVLAAQFRLLPD